MFNTEYKVHKTSWKKLFSYAITNILLTEILSIDLTGPIGAIYFGSNIYNRYQYNESLKYSFNIKKDIHVRTINAYLEENSPENTSYISYNLYLTISSISYAVLTYSDIDDIQLFSSVSTVVFGSVGGLLWLGHELFASDYECLNFEDNTGNTFKLLKAF